MKYKDMENVRLVELDQLQNERGEVIELVEDETTEMNCDAIGVDQNGYVSNGPKTIKIKRVRALVGNNRDEEFENMTRERDDAVTSMNVAVSEKQHLELNVIKKLENNIVALNNEFKSARNVNEMLEKDRSNYYKKIQQYEQDIGKLTSAFGELRIKEILDESI